MSANPSMKHDKPLESDERGRVLRFEPRRGSQRPGAPGGPSPVQNLDKYARRPDEHDDYRHRMRVNVAALLFVGLLIWCGYWLFGTIAEMKKNQDCALTGRTNCALINIPPDTR